MRERHIQVRRTARYCVLPDDDARRPRELWFVLHGYRQLAARFLRRFEAVAAPDRLVVAPEALSRFYLEDDGGPHGPEARVGATWMTREDRLAEIDDYVAYLDALHAEILDRHDAAGARVLALGFSQGAATASRWLALGRARIDRLVLWAGRLPPDLDLGAAAARLRGCRLTYIVGEADPWAGPDAIARERARLEPLGIPYELIRYAGGHEIEPSVLERALAGVLSSPEDG